MRPHYGDARRRTKPQRPPMNHHTSRIHAPLLSDPHPSSASPASPGLLAVAWVDAFNASSVDRLALLYAEDAEFDQPVEEPEMGRDAAAAFLAKCFALHRKTSNEDRSCLIDNLLLDGEWAVVRWHDALGCTGCYMFRCVEGAIVRQYGFWDTQAMQMAYETELP